MKNFNNLTKQAKEEIIGIIIEELEHNALPEEKIADRYNYLSELHNRCFNEDYFIIGYYSSSKWIENNWLDDTFDAINTVKEYEEDHFGSMTTSINSESICNMLVYIIGEELIYFLDEDIKIKKAIKKLKKLI